MAFNNSIGGQFSLLSRLLGGEGRSTLTGMGDFTPDQEMAPVNPMQSIVDQVVAQAQLDGSAVTLDAIVLAGQSSGLSADQIANLQNVQMGAVQFTDTGLQSLQQMNNGDRININIAGADISGSTFHPESSFEGIIIDEVTPGGQVVAGPDTTMQFMNFRDFSLQADIELQGDVSYLTISGTRENGAKQPNISFSEDTVARGVNMEDARLATLEVGIGADLTGLEASGASALRVDAVGATLNGADFTGSSFGFNGRMENCDLVAADFEGATLADLNLSGSNLTGANFKGVDLSEVNLTGATIDAESLIGARYDGTAIDSEEAAVAFMHSRQMDHAGGNVPLEVATVENELHAIAAQRAAGPTPYIPQLTPEQQAALTTPEQAPAVSTPETDAFIDQIAALHGSMLVRGISHDTSDEFSPAINHETDKYRIEHEGLDRAMT